MTAIQFWTGPSIIFIHQPHSHSISPQGLMQASFWEPPHPSPPPPPPNREGKRDTAVWWTGLEACTTSYLYYEHAWPWQNCISMSSSLMTLFWREKKKIKNEQGSHSLVPNCLSYKHCWLQFITRAMANTQAGITKSWNAKELKILHVIHSVQMVFRKKSRGPVWKWNQILDFQNPFLTDFHWD